jgi:hypothetical protein
MPSAATVIAAHPGVVDGHSWDLTVLKDAGDVTITWTGTYVLLGTVPHNLLAGSNTTFRFTIANTQQSILVYPIARCV